MRCSEKSAYRTRKKAIKTRDRVSGRTGHKLSVYRCHRCGWWHLTHLESKTLE